ncbi:hypothetical protein [Myxococcus sp. Y35]|uniref:hypothetical protein n=1 Tax=Pseudomyxococcus flavus TaxID=3115648 RepID=UPI003CEF54C8
MVLSRCFVLVVLLALTGACSATEACPRDAHSGFEPRAPFDARASVRRVDCGFLSSVQGLALGPDGSTWLRRTEFEDRGEESFFAPPVKRMTRVGPDGELLGEFPIGEVVQHFTVHPSGELTVMGWDVQEDPLRLQVRRLRPDGSLLAERVLVSGLPSEERLSYAAYPDGRVERVTLTAAEQGLGALAMVAHGEDAVLLLGMDGLRLLRLDAALDTRWMEVVSPSVVLRADTLDEMRALGAPFSGWALGVDAAGDIHVASPFLVAHRSAYQDALGRVPEGPEGRGILLTRFDGAGTRQSARTLPAAHVEEITGLAVEGAAFAVGAKALSPLTGTEGKSTDQDLFFASGRWDRPAEEVVLRAFSLENDDHPSAFVACGAGRYCFAGHTGYVDLDTGGRTLTNGKGFLLAVDAQGQPVDSLRLEGPRDTEVVAAVSRPDGSLVFAFATDQAPNPARVSNGQKNNETWLGVLAPAP